MSNISALYSKCGMLFIFVMSRRVASCRVASLRVAFPRVTKINSTPHLLYNSKTQYHSVTSHRVVSRRIASHRVALCRKHKRGLNGVLFIFVASCRIASRRAAKINNILHFTYKSTVQFNSVTVVTSRRVVSRYFVSQS